MDDITQSENARSEMPKHERSTHTVEAVLFDYRQLTHANDEDDEDVIVDLLADLMHYADAHDLVDFDDLVERAHVHHAAETPEED